MDFEPQTQGKKKKKPLNFKNMKYPKTPRNSRFQLWSQTMFSTPRIPGCPLTLYPMYSYSHVCMYVSLYVCTYVCMYVCMNDACVYACMYMNVYTNTSIDAPICYIALPSCNQLYVVFNRVYPKSHLALSRTPLYNPSVVDAHGIECPIIMIVAFSLL